MKKHEWMILAGVVLLCVLAVFFQLFRKKPSGYVVAVQHGNEIVKEFDPMENQVYHIDGDCGGLEVEVKDGKWHVINEKCPNHVCAQMGWMSTEDSLFPITCLPNNIIIYLEESPQ